MIGNDRFEIPISVMDFARHMQNYIKEQSTQARSTILNGAAEDFSSYRELVGYLRGLDEIASAVDAAARAAEKGAK